MKIDKKSIMNLTSLAIVLALGLIVGFFVGVESVVSPIDIKLVAVIIGLISFSFAVNTFAIKDRREKSKLLLEQSEELFERALKELVGNDEKLHSPGCRLKWNVCARYLNTGLSLGSQISDSTIKIIYDEMKRSFRNRFYELLSDEGLGLPVEYFRTASNLGVYVISAENIHAFAAWGDNENDVLDGTRLSLKKIKNNYPQYLGFIQYAAEQIAKKQG